MGKPNRRTEKVLARQIEMLRAELHEKEFEYNLLDCYLNEAPDPDLDRPSDEAIERDIVAVLEEAEALEAKLVAAMKTWSSDRWRELGQ